MPQGSWLNLTVVLGILLFGTAVANADESGMSFTSKFTNPEGSTTIEQPRMLFTDGYRRIQRNPYAGTSSGLRPEFVLVAEGAEGVCRRFGFTRHVAYSFAEIGGPDCLFRTDFVKTNNDGLPVGEVDACSFERSNTGTQFFTSVTCAN